MQAFSVFYFVTLRLDKTLMIVDRSDYALPSVYRLQLDRAFVKPTLIFIYRYLRYTLA